MLCFSVNKSILTLPYALIDEDRNRAFECRLTLKTWLFCYSLLSFSGTWFPIFIEAVMQTHNTQIYQYKDKKIESTMHWNQIFVKKNIWKDEEKSKIQIQGNWISLPIQNIIISSNGKMKIIQIQEVTKLYIFDISIDLFDE
jgi:hypothetical protein